ncbi:GNAT family N-acetyltransferase [Peptoniphilus sp. KCTC 25270]|uniref:GNAT family N-acetyltransferase n=1 Tax=Peptoniphilus sp. KCTC 25270 TaxID=2897414 RepID=UPI001E4B31D4|nr:GNAT family N-acetyltransferase [Peptoniphilus sp. KCTC 25270]MCD1146682.1 GNAT family N-acetyltransferase [Peptoniphilus sp. KCTC 25270]
MFTIKPIPVSDLEPLLEVYLNSYPAFKTLDLDGIDFYRKKTLHELEKAEDIDFFGCYEDNRLIASMKIIDFSMNYFGEMRKAKGLMSLAVHPFHRKKGVAFQMVQFFENFSKESGASTAILLPFNISFYRNMGYGLGARMDEYHVETKNLPPCEDSSRLAYVPREDLPKILDAYHSFAEKNHGTLCRFSEEIFWFERDEETLVVGIYEGHSLSAYIRYHFENGHDNNYTQNRIIVDELVYNNSKELRELIGFLERQKDMVQSVVLRSGKEDFYHFIQDPQHISKNYIPYGYLQTNVSAVGNMYKILDLEKFFQDTSHRKFPSTSLKLSITLFDEIQKTEEEFFLTFQEKEDHSSHWKFSKEGSGNVHLKCNRATLSALLLNAASFHSLVEMGLIELEEKELAQELDRLFHYFQKPFSNSDY